MTLLDRKSDLLDTKVPLLTRIKFPRVWKRLDGGIRVEDLQEDRFDEALEHIKTFYITEEALCCLSRISEDTESIENYMKLIRWWMQDTQSLVAIIEETGKIIGVLIGRVHDSYLMKTLSRVMDYNGEPLRKIQRFKMFISKAVDINKIFKVENYNEIYIWSVNTSYRNKGIGKGLLQACIEQTKSFKIKVLVGVFTNLMTQTMVRSEGFYSLYELPYNNWKARAPVVFKDHPMKKECAKLMALYLENAQYGYKCEEIIEKYNISKLFVSKSVKRKSIRKDDKETIEIN